MNRSRRVYSGRGIRLTASEVELATSTGNRSSSNNDFIPSGTAITMVPGVSGDEVSDDEEPQDLLERYRSSPYKKTIEI